MLSNSRSACASSTPPSMQATKATSGRRASPLDVRSSCVGKGSVIRPLGEARLFAQPRVQLGHLARDADAGSFARRGVFVAVAQLLGDGGASPLELFFAHAQFEKAQDSTQFRRGVNKVTIVVRDQTIRGVCVGEYLSVVKQ